MPWSAVPSTSWTGRTVTHRAAQEQHRSVAVSTGSTGSASADRRPGQPTSLWRRAARSPSTLRASTTREDSCALRRRALHRGAGGRGASTARFAGPGRSRLASPIARIVVAGARPCTRRPTIVSGVSSTVGRPARTPETMRRAARSAEMLRPGIDASGREPRVVGGGVVDEPGVGVPAGPHEAGGHRRHGDPRAGQLGVEALGEPDGPELRDRVRDQPGHRDEATHRRDDADPAVPGIPHRREHGEREVHRPPEHRVDRVLVVAQRQGVGMAHLDDARDVDRDVDPALGADDLVDQCRDRVLVPHVTGAGDEARAGDGGRRGGGRPTAARPRRGRTRRRRGHARAAARRRAVPALARRPGRAPVGRVDMECLRRAWVGRMAARASGTRGRGVAHLLPRNRGARTSGQAARCEKRFPRAARGRGR